MDLDSILTLVKDFYPIEIESQLRFAEAFG